MSFLFLFLLAPQQLVESPESRALAYLAVEVPRWSKEKRCYSCHNDGDGARALFKAAKLGEKVAAESIETTTRWLIRPDHWEKNGGDGPFSDKTLARLQFTIALASAVEAGKADRGVLRSAATRLGELQADNGSWPIDEPGPIGSPTTYGRPLGTILARDALMICDPVAFRDQIARADRYLKTIEPSNVDDAATILLSGSSQESKRRQAALEILRKAESPDGGWGPFVRSPPQTFDTALALLAIDRNRDQPGVAAMIARGRSALIDSQMLDGSWVETTRPSGGESYAQRISTTAWATMALMATRPANR